MGPIVERHSSERRDSLSFLFLGLNRHMSDSCCSALCVALESPATAYLADSAGKGGGGGGVVRGGGGGGGGGGGF